MRKYKLLLSIGVSGSAALFCLSGEKVNDYLPKRKVLLAATVDKVNGSSKWDYNWDQRDPSNLIRPSKLENLSDDSDHSLQQLIKEYTPTSTRHLIFIRHGQYNTKFKEDEKRTLTQLGQEQAVFTGIRLRELDIPFDKVIESSMTRAIETSSLICDELKDVKLERTDLLREGSPIQPEPPFRHWRPYISTYTDGPRIESAFRKYVHRAELSQTRDTYELFVCHANVIRYFVCRALQVPPEAWLRISLRHGSITWITIRPNGYVSLRCLGEAGHMPADKLSSE